MISRPPLMRYFDILLTWNAETQSGGAFRAFSSQLRELRSIEALVETLPIEYSRRIDRMSADIREYGVHEGTALDFSELRTIEREFAPHPSRLHDDKEKQDLLAALMLKAYSVYECPAGASPLRAKNVVIKGDDRYVYTCPVTCNDGTGAQVEAFFECEFSRDDLSLLSARFERSVDGYVFGRISEPGIDAVNEERDEILQSMGLTSVPTI
jgi:hypothetical protein